MYMYIAIKFRAATNDYFHYQLIYDKSVICLVTQCLAAGIISLMPPPLRPAGMTQHHWSEEASMLFRNHVEDRALVAQVESVQDVSEVKGEQWERKLTVYLVDTTLEDRDLWIHSIMADIGGELSSAA